MVCSPIPTRAFPREVWARCARLSARRSLTTYYPELASTCVTRVHPLRLSRSGLKCRCLESSLLSFNTQHRLRLTGSKSQEQMITTRPGTFCETHRLGFTGRIETTMEQRLGRHLDQRRQPWSATVVDTIGGLNNDNTCGGCHSPTNAFGDTQSIAIGIDNNGIVGHIELTKKPTPTPMAINTAFS